MTDTRHTQSHLSRRLFLSLGAAGACAALAKYWPTATQVQAASPASDKVEIAEFSSAGQLQKMEIVPTIRKTAAEWARQLSPLAYHVTREEGTEQSYTGPNWDQHGAGLYRCICCDTALFRSTTKFDSGTGWPSFYQAIAKQNVSEKSDSSLGMERTAVSCARCAAHLGHVFDDGPRPTGLRYCMNGAAMRFERAS